jgi:hypothetical protein
MSSAATGNRNWRRVIRLETLRKTSTNAREVWLRRFMLFEIINHTKALEQLPCIWDIPIDMTVFEFDDIMSFIGTNNIARDQYRHVLQTTRISRV